MFIWAVLPIFLLGLLEGGLIGVLFILGTVQIVFVSGAGIAVVGLGAALATPMLCFLLGGVILHCLIAVGFFRSVHHIYII